MQDIQSGCVWSVCGRVRGGGGDKGLEAGREVEADLGLWGD